MHQLPDGGWSFDHERACGKKCDQPGIETGRNGATGLALMTFLGAGQTHLEGEYKESVFRGLSYLMKSMEVKGVSSLMEVGSEKGMRCTAMASPPSPCVKRMR